jgi:hypothetical protein
LKSRPLFKNFHTKKEQGTVQIFLRRAACFFGKRFGGTNPALESAAGNITRTVIAKSPALR